MTAVPLDLEQRLDFLARVYEERIPFNRLLGLKVTHLGNEEAATRFDLADDFIGNFAHRTLHGGVISTVLDATGGLTASAGVLTRMGDRPLAAVEKQLTQIGTIDLRIDYLRPGRGTRFSARGAIMRTGNKVAVIRMELTNEKSLIIAVGTGTYLVG
jgi:uncharacterized protein (TIGR00369 family)